MVKKTPNFTYKKVVVINHSSIFGVMIDSSMKTAAIVNKQEKNKCSARNY